MKIVLPEKVNEIIHTLQDHGFDAYAVGGCVRDSVLQKEPQDWDITTSAKPEQVKKIFKRTVDTGIEHGTVTVLLDKDGFEVTTYRIDGEYEDCRHPKEVTFTNQLIEDLKRRDFTVNAMAYNETEGFVDAFGGLKDLQNKIIRCVGKAEDRFTEDALRILRAIRFSAQLSFVIEEETSRAIEKLAPNLAKISAERIQVELIKLLESGRPDHISIAQDTGVLKVILPEVSECFVKDEKEQYKVSEEIKRGLLILPPDKVLRLAMLLKSAATDRPEETTRQILRRLRFDNDTLRKVVTLVKYQTLTLRAEKRAIRYQVNDIGVSLFKLLLQLKEATDLAKGKPENERNIYREVEKLLEEILTDGECVNLKMLSVSGDDLIELGVKQGKEMGQLLQELLRMVLDDPSKNKVEYLKNYCKKRVSVT